MDADSGVCKRKGKERKERKEKREGKVRAEPPCSLRNQRQQEFSSSTSAQPEVWRPSEANAEHEEFTILGCERDNTTICAKLSRFGCAWNCGHLFLKAEIMYSSFFVLYSKLKTLLYIRLLASREALSCERQKTSQVTVVIWLDPD